VILPSKRLRIDLSILGSGGEILQHLNEPKQVSRVWDEIKKMEIEKSTDSKITYDWFILSLDFLFLLGIIEIDDGIIKKVKP
jgi:hypothetical protein